MAWWKFVPMLIALLVPGGSLLFVAWAAAKAFRAHREVTLHGVPVALASPARVGRTPER